ncbi:hypothetical protein, partial [Rhodanobacter sp. 115]|uniref:hypothetical protein n=1 Tax=Rhodanobacter sp. FW021-MT20 TaxID=1162282 RepID=UPI001ED8FE66
LNDLRGRRKKLHESACQKAGWCLVFAPRRWRSSARQPGKKKDCLQVLTDRKIDVEWAAHPGRNVSGQLEERVASD